MNLALKVGEECVIAHVHHLLLLLGSILPGLQMSSSKSNFCVQHWSERSVWQHTMEDSCGKVAKVCALLLLLEMVASSPVFDYQEALSKSILFYEAQRSGQLPQNQRVAWRGNSALEDGSDGKVNLSGGYYDAGDNVKFGFPMAFTITMLSWGAVEYGNYIAHAGELGNVRDAIRWGTDYLMRANTGPRQLWVQVGDPYKDHNCWQRPEDMEPPRKAYLINETSPGTEVAAETAAALAAASIVFRDADPSYSNKMLESAKLLFEFADEFRGTFAGGCPFYCSVSGYNDELLWAASWLYKATGSATYSNYVIHNANTTGVVSEFSWENKHAGVQVLLSTFYLAGRGDSLRQYKDDADFFFCATLPNTPQTTVSRTPGGLLYIRSGANTQYATGASYLAAVYADYLEASNGTVSCGNNATLSPKDLFDFAVKQANYILGDNPLKMSYMVGFRNSSPQQPHHRGASIASIHRYPNKVLCGEGFRDWYGQNASNPNVLTGAIVGGPDQADRFTDLRSNSAQLEPTTYINAPFVGLLARLYRSHI